MLEALRRPRDVLGEFGLYVHIPFCSHRCWYCDFNAYADLDHLMDDYMAALVSEVESSLDSPVTSVFIGGGTPSRVDPAWIARLLSSVVSAPGAEVTIECNPESTDAAKLEVYLSAGVNRISFGVQSLDDSLLARLGRVHDAATALSALRLARSVGFENVSADLIFGIPSESDASLRASLDGVLSTDVSHVSCYALIYEEGTPLDSWRKLGKVVPVPDDDVARRWEITDSALSGAGLPRYEISNWGRPSRHNSLYWAAGEYVGVGAGAHSYIAPTRSWNVKSPAKYIAGARTAGSEVIDARTRATEVMLLGLRRTDGVDVNVFRELTGLEFEEMFGDVLESPLLTFDGKFVRCSQPLLLNEATVLFCH